MCGLWLDNGWECDQRDAEQFLFIRDYESIYMSVIKVNIYSQCSCNCFFSIVFDYGKNNFNISIKTQFGI